MTGKTFFIGFGVFLALFAAGLFYSINYAYYDRITVGELTLNTDQGELKLSNVDMINSDRTALKIRICADRVNIDGFQETNTATPLVAPFWFKCFDAKKLDAEIAEGTLKSYRIETNTPYGFDLYLAQNEKQSYVWRQINECGEARFSGLNLPDTCPEFKE